MSPHKSRVSLLPCFFVATIAAAPMSGCSSGASDMGPTLPTPVDGGPTAPDDATPTPTPTPTPDAGVSSDAGAVDTSFGIDGFVPLPATPRYLALDPDGKIRMCVRSHARRYLTTGAVDTTFGSDATAHETPVACGALTRLSSGAYLAYVPGGAFLNSSHQRLDANGIRDLSFGTGGQVDYDSEHTILTVYAAQNANDVITYVGNQSYNSYEFAALRFDGSGAGVATFATAGLFRPPFGDPFKGFAANAMVTTDDGRVWMTGAMYGGVGGPEALVLDSDGTLREALLSGIRSNTGPLRNAGLSQVHGVASAGGGAVFISGKRSDELVVAKVASPSALDVTFGNGGIVTLKPDASAISDRLLVLADGRVLLVGRAGKDLFIARLLANGALDPNFGKSGWARPALGQEAYATGAAVAPNGDVVMAVARTSGDVLVRIKM